MAANEKPPLLVPVPHLFSVLVEIIPVPGEDRICVEGNLEFATRQFMHDIKNIPPRLYYIGEEGRGA